MNKKEREEYNERISEYLENDAVFSGIPKENLVKKGKITVIWQDLDETIYTFQIDSKKHFKNLWNIATVIDRTKEKKYNASTHA